MKIVTSFDAFNERRYSNPWIGIVNSHGKIDFNQDVGGYTGTYNKGEEGELYVTDPQEGQIYAYGQKDYRKPRNSFTKYVMYIEGEFIQMSRAEMLKEVLK